MLFQPIPFPLPMLEVQPLISIPWGALVPGLWSKKTVFQWLFFLSVFKFFSARHRLSFHDMFCVNLHDDLLVIILGAGEMGWPPCSGRRLWRNAISGFDSANWALRVEASHASSPTGACLQQQGLCQLHTVVSWPCYWYPELLCTHGRPIWWNKIAYPCPKQDLGATWNAMNLTCLTQVRLLAVSLQADELGDCSILLWWLHDGRSATNC